MKWKPCKQCIGQGGYYREVFKPHNAGRDVGVIDENWTTCESCGGTGEINYYSDTSAHFRLLPPAEVTRGQHSKTAEVTRVNTQKRRK